VQSCAQGCQNHSHKSQSTAARLNEALQLILATDKGLEGKKDLGAA